MEAMALCGRIVLPPPINGTSHTLGGRLPVFFPSQKQSRQVIRRCAPRAGPAANRPGSLAETRMYGRVPSCKNLSELLGKLLSTVVAIAATSVAVTSIHVAAAEAVEKLGFSPAGEAFERTCAACHSGGGNLLQPSATLFSKDLKKNGLEAVDDIFKVTYFGKNRMPGYGERCTPRGQCTFGPRLSEEDIRTLAEYVKQQADQGWPKVSK